MTSTSGQSVPSSTESVVMPNIPPSLRVGITTLNRPGTYGAPTCDDCRCTDSQPEQQLLGGTHSFGGILP
ncbi:hypothetical protein GCM10009776_37700 [Microbacterium deminutum]|uniref:Uncharacterized protein n=1 Tax=Microbacterium deminutum TaxID=344164 RepID=A0ABP5CYM7_9MICO